MVQRDLSLRLLLAPYNIHTNTNRGFIGSFSITNNVYTFSTFSVSHLASLSSNSLCVLPVPPKLLTTNDTTLTVSDVDTLECTLALETLRYFHPGIRTPSSLTNLVQTVLSLPTTVH